MRFVPRASEWPPKLFVTFAGGSRRSIGPPRSRPARILGDYKNRAMVKIIACMMTIVLIAALTWQLVDAAPEVPRAVSALLLVVVCFLAGLRVGADSAAAYIRDLQRLNKMMAEQQQDLEEMNSMLLRNTNAASEQRSAKSS